MDQEQWIISQAQNKIYKIPRIKQLIESGNANRFDIDQVIQDTIINVRTGRNNTRMRASDCLVAAEAAVRNRYKGVKLNAS